MFCRKCGKQIPDDSDFCPKCGTRNAIDIELEDVDDDNNDFDVPNHQPVSNPIVKNPVLYCPKCKNRIFVEWDRCATCGTINPYNPNAKFNQADVIVPPPPQVIIKEERIVIKEEKKPEEKGCGTWLAECFGGFLVICFLIGMIQSCLG